MQVAGSLSLRGVRYRIRSLTKVHMMTHLNSVLSINHLINDALMAAADFQTLLLRLLVLLSSLSGPTCVAHK